MPKDRIQTTNTFEIIFRNWARLNRVQKLILILGGLIIAYVIARFIQPENDPYRLQQPETPSRSPVPPADLVSTQPPQHAPHVPLPQLHIAAVKAEKKNLKLKKLNQHRSNEIA